MTTTPVGCSDAGREFHIGSYVSGTLDCAMLIPCPDKGGNDFHLRSYVAGVLNHAMWRLQNVDRTAPPVPVTPPTVAAAGGNPVYVKAAIDAEFAKLAAAAEGCRNETLIRVACNVFEFVKGGHVHRDAAEAELARVAAAIGLDDREIHATLRSAWQRTRPRAVPAPASSTPAHTVDPEEIR